MEDKSVFLEQLFQSTLRLNSLIYRMPSSPGSFHIYDFVGAVSLRVTIRIRILPDTLAKCIKFWQMHNAG